MASIAFSDEEHKPVYSACHTKLSMLFFVNNSVIVAPATMKHYQNLDHLSP